MSLYVIRHGQTPMNGQRVFNGETDEVLSETGISQASEAGKLLRDKKIDIIFCSPLTRTRQTLELLNLDKSIPVKFDDRIVERIEGSLTGTPITDELLNQLYLSIYPSEYVEGLESVTEVMLRVYSFLAELESKYKDKNILLVTHGFVGRTIYHYFNGLEDTKSLAFSKDSYQNNCEIREYDFSKKNKWWKGLLEPYQTPKTM